MVGIWGVASALFATLFRTVFGRSRAEARRVDGRWYAASAVALGILAVPGVVAGLRTASGSSAVADYIQVYYRLAHHLDPLHFAEWAWIGDGLNWLLALLHRPPLDFTGWPWVAYGLLVCFWLCGRRWMARCEPERWFFWFIVGSGLIATLRFSGRLAVRSARARAELPHSLERARLSVAVEAAEALSVPFIRCSVAHRGLNNGRRNLPALVRVRLQGRADAGPFPPHDRLDLASLRNAGLVACLFRAPDARPPFTPAQLADWLDVCRWVEHNTPQNALILTPTQQTWAFKWYAQRAEYVSYKDCPQDGPGIVEWNNRLLYLADWTAHHAETGYTAADMAPLRAGHFVHRGPGAGDVSLSAGLSQCDVPGVSDKRAATDTEVLTVSSSDLDLSYNSFVAAAGYAKIGVW